MEINSNICIHTCIYIYTHILINPHLAFWMIEHQHLIYIMFNRVLVLHHIFDLRFSWLLRSSNRFSGCCASTWKWKGLPLGWKCGGWAQWMVFLGKNYRKHPYVIGKSMVSYRLPPSRSIDERIWKASGSTQPKISEVWTKILRMESPSSSPEDVSVTTASMMLKNRAIELHCQKGEAE